MDYRQLHERLCRRELEIEQALARAVGDPSWAEDWGGQHGLGWIEFLELLWAARRCASVDDLVRAAGTVHLGLTLLEILEQDTLVEVDHDGRLSWRRALFPESGRRIDELEQRLAGWLAALTPEPRFGQLQASVSSSLARADALLEDLPPFGRSVLFLGDDDLSSVALGARLHGSIVAVDVDARVLEQLGRVVAEYALDIEPLEHDVRSRLPKRLRGQFDTVHCDPVDDGAWLEAWLRAGLAALAPEAGVRLVLSINLRRLGPRVLGLHRFMVEHGFVLDRRLPATNRYALAGIGDSFYQTYHERLLERPWRDAVDWGVYTDLLVFRRQGAARHLWPQSYRELRRGV